MISAKGTFTYAKNQYMEIDEPDYEYAYMSQVGRPLNQYKGYIALGLFKDQEEIDNSPKQILTGVVQPGDIKYADLNNDGKIDGNDQTYIGNPELPRNQLWSGSQYPVQKMGCFHLLSRSRRKEASC